MAKDDELIARLIELDRLPIPPDPGMPILRPARRGSLLTIVSGVAAAALVAIVVVTQLTQPAPSIGPAAGGGASPSPVPATARVSLPPGRCTSPTTTTRGVIENYLALTTSNDQAAVRDCFAAAYVQRHGVSTAWASAGPIRNSAITFESQLRGCDWFRVEAEFLGRNPDSTAASSSYLRFIGVGIDGDSPRIQDQATALVRPEFANDPSIQLPECRR
jgi:hypothetical protein